MVANPLLKLQEFGQSVWLDYIDRKMLSSGHLKRLIEEDGLKGVTSNPAIFEKAIAGSADYDEDIRRLASQGKNLEEIYWTLTIADVQAAADLLRPVYESINGRDGFVSLELNSHLARDTAESIAQGPRAFCNACRNWASSSTRPPSSWKTKAWRNSSSPMTA